MPACLSPIPAGRLTCLRRQACPVVRQAGKHQYINIAVMDFITTDGIVLKKRLRGEHDGDITLLTKEFGKIRAHASGLYKITSRLSSRLEPSNYVSANLIFKKDRVQLVNAHLNQFFSFRDDPARLKTALLMTALVDLLVPDGFPDSHIFDLLSTSLSSLNAVKAPFSQRMLTRHKWLFLARLLQMLGLFEGGNILNEKNFKTQIKKAFRTALSHAR